MEEPTNRRMGRQPPSRRRTLLAVDKAYWSAGGRLECHQQVARIASNVKQRLSLGTSVNAWIAYMADPGLSMRVSRLADSSARICRRRYKQERERRGSRDGWAKVFLLSGWYSMVKVDTVPFFPRRRAGGALGAMLAGAKAPMGLALIAKRSAWVVAEIDYVNIRKRPVSVASNSSNRFSEQKMCVLFHIVLGDCKRGALIQASWLHGKLCGVRLWRDASNDEPKMCVVPRSAHTDSP